MYGRHESYKYVCTVYRKYTDAPELLPCSVRTYVVIAILCSSYESGKWCIHQTLVLAAVIAIGSQQRLAAM